MISDQFKMNNYLWTVEFVEPNSPMLVDRTAVLTVATTDPVTNTIYLANTLAGDFLMRVFIHEMGHCALYSFDLLGDIQRMTKPQYVIDMEEFICNFLADYGWGIYKKAFATMGYDAWKLVPQALEKYVA